MVNLALATCLMKRFKLEEDMENIFLPYIKLFMKPLGKENNF
jgi:hypothetical protein